MIRVDTQGCRTNVSNVVQIQKLTDLVKACTRASKKRDARSFQTDDTNEGDGDPEQQNDEEALDDDYEEDGNEEDQDNGILKEASIQTRVVKGDSFTACRLLRKHRAAMDRRICGELPVGSMGRLRKRLTERVLLSTLFSGMATDMMGIDF
eukprot:6251250-Amphidinium_carterae.1